MCPARLSARPFGFEFSFAVFSFRCCFFDVTTRMLMFTLVMLYVLIPDRNHGET